MEAAIQVRELRKSYKDLNVLKGVDLDVARGSIFALLGANGAGKTTLVRILATLLKADSGTATVSGLDVAAQPARIRGAISLTGQFAAVDEILTGRENLIMGAAGRRVATYSGGMRRRLDIAMSLIGDPRVVFLDEPTTGIDPEGRREVWPRSSPTGSRSCTAAPSSPPAPWQS
jgi:ABC-2 type transport system ATP-binding protein